MVEECIENIVGNKMVHVNLNDYENACNSFTVYIVLFVISLLIMIGISSIFIYFQWYLKKSTTNITNMDPGTERVTY